MSRTTIRNPTLPARAASSADPEVRLAEIEGNLDFPALFGRPGHLAVEVEVGFGKGRFLLGEAAARPDTLILGIEYALPYLRLVRFRTLFRGLSNVRLVHANARDLFASRIPEESLGAVHVLFPDPWPKRKHRPRRLVQHDFLASVASTLVRGGTLNVATDHAEYAASIAEAAARVPELVPSPVFALGPDLAARTHFAAKLASRVPAFHARSWTRAR